MSSFSRWKSLLFREKAEECPSYEWETEAQRVGAGLPRVSKQGVHRAGPGLALSHSVCMGWSCPSLALGVSVCPRESLFIVSNPGME